MRLEEYILKRKMEDGINEFDKDKRAENTRICVNYVFEYFNNYLETSAGEEKTFLHDEKIEKYARTLGKYSDEIQEWLVDMYSSYGRYLSTTIPRMIKDPYFLLYDSEAEFRALSYELYPKVVKKYDFMKSQSEMLFRFIKDEHHARSLISEEFETPHITDNIDEWISKTYLKYGVNIYNFCSEYIFSFLDDPDRWPKAHKKRSEYYDEYSKQDGKYRMSKSFLYDYDYKQKSNLFGLDMLYREMPKKPFIKGKKQEIECILLYIYCHEWENQEQYWEEYSEKMI